MIKIKSEKNYLVALESVAMTDIVLNMFIFFFIAFSLLYTFTPERMSRIDVNLPKASSAVALEGSRKTIIAITKSGEFFVGDEKIRHKELKNVLMSKLKEEQSLAIFLKVDTAAKFSNVVRVLDVINELKIKKVSVAAVKSQ